MLHSTNYCRAPFLVHSETNHLLSLSLYSNLRLRLSLSVILYCSIYVLKWKDSKIQILTSGPCPTPPLPTTLTWWLTGPGSITTSWQATSAAAPLAGTPPAASSSPRPRRGRFRRFSRGAWQSLCILSKTILLNLNYYVLLYSLLKARLWKISWLVLLYQKYVKLIA